MTKFYGPANLTGAPRIEEVRITPVAFRDPPLLAASGMHEPWTTRTIIEIECEGGFVGLAETYGDIATIADLRAVAPRLVGLQAADVASIRTQIIAQIEAETVIGHQGAVVSPRTDTALRFPRIYAAFEAASLDAAARAFRMPLASLLGGPFRSKVPFAAYLFFKPATHPGGEGKTDRWGEVLNADTLVAEAAQMIDRFGFKALKLKGGVLEPELEVDCIAELSRAYPDMPLRIDPNGNWTVETTLSLLPRLEGLLEYLEDPVLGLEAMAQIKSKMTIPLATNMCVTGFQDIPEAIRLGAVDIVLADHHFWGGLRETVALDRLCATFDMGLSMHSNSHLGVSLMTMTHVAAACRQLTYDSDTHYVWTESDIVDGGPIAFEDGCVMLTDEPGLGVVLDKNAIAAMAKDYATLGVMHRDDTKYMRHLWPSWTPDRPRF